MQYRFSCFHDPQLFQKIQTKTLRRLDTLVELFERLEKGGVLEGVHLNTGVLYSALESYFIDIQRTKCFHDIEFADSHKIAAYTVKWLLKLRPIMISAHIKSKDLSKRTLLANEIFALIIALRTIDVDVNRISNKYISNLIYIFRYRDIDCLALSSKMYLLETCLSGDGP